MHIHRSGFDIDLRNTLVPIDLMEEPWAKQYAWMARIDHRGFTEFEIVDAEIRFSLGRTRLVLTIMDSFSCWFEVGFTLESTAKRERREGLDGLRSLMCAAGVRMLDDAEKLVGKKGAFRVKSTKGDLEFMPLEYIRD